MLLLKHGGAAMSGDGDVARGFARDVAWLHAEGRRLAIVHGGGSAITRLSERLGLGTRFVRGHRYTDAATREVATMVLAGSAGKELVRTLVAEGVPAVGISGIDGGLLRACRHRPDGADIGFVGEVTAVRTELVEHLVSAGFVPVIAPLALDEEGEILNVNADLAAAALAAALRAESFLFMSDIDGVRVGGDVVDQIDEGEIDRLIMQGGIYGGMIPKVEAALSAIHAGVPEVRIVNGTTPGIVRAVAEGSPIGTRISGVHASPLFPDPLSVEE